MPGHAQQERHRLTDLLDEVGPQAATLCEGWTTVDLAAHLIIREHRPDAAAGMVVPGLSAYAERVRRSVRENPDWSQLVDQIRAGPPWPMRAVDETVNTVEYFVHHEDVRRARAGYTVRVLDRGLEEALWSRIKPPFGRFLVRRSPVGVSVESPGFGRARLKQASDSVTVRGRPSELALFLFGRRDVAAVELDGDDLAVARLRRAKLGF